MDERRQLSGSAPTGNGRANGPLSVTRKKNALLHLFFPILSCHRTSKKKKMMACQDKEGLLRTYVGISFAFHRTPFFPRSFTTKNKVIWQTFPDELLREKALFWNSSLSLLFHSRHWIDSQGLSFVSHPSCKGKKPASTLFPPPLIPSAFQP